MPPSKDLEAGDQVDYIVATQEAYDKIASMYKAKPEDKVGDPLGVRNRLYGIPIEVADTEAAAMFRAAELSHKGLKVCVLIQKTTDEVEPV